MSHRTDELAAYECAQVGTTVFNKKVYISKNLMRIV